MQSLATSRYETLRFLKSTGLSLRKTAYKAGASGPLHTHENARFVFVLRGTFDELYGRRKRNCSPFTLIFRPPDEKHKEDYGPGGVIGLSVDIEPSWMERLRQHSIEFVDSSDFRSASLSTLAIKLDNELSIGDKTSALAIEALLLETAIEAYRGGIVKRDHAPRWLRRAQDFIHNEFCHEVTLTQISAVAGVHPAHLARVFRQHHRCTIAEYVRRLRVEAACSAMATPGSSLAQIAVTTGFSDQSHFCRIFKRLTGVTPTEYRAACCSR